MTCWFFSLSHLRISFENIYFSNVKKHLSVALCSYSSVDASPRDPPDARLLAAYSAACCNVVVLFLLLLSSLSTATISAPEDQAEQ